MKVKCERMYPSMRGWLDACKEHSCDQKAMKTADRLIMVIGAECACGEWFGIRVCDMKASMEGLSEEQRKTLRSTLKTAEGRKALVASFS